MAQPHVQGQEALDQGPEQYAGVSTLPVHPFKLASKPRSVRPHDGGRNIVPFGGRGQVVGVLSQK